MLSGFGNHFETESIQGTLPIGQNSPQRVAHGLYAEQLSGSAFTAPRPDNLRSWLYRIRPSVIYGEFTPNQKLKIFDWEGATFSPNPMRWDPLGGDQPLDLPLDWPFDWMEGLHPWVANGSESSGAGCAVYLYACSKSMTDRYFYDADAELLLVPQEGELELHTEFGRFTCKPTEIAVIPRGVKFQVLLPRATKIARGYVCENFGLTLRLPGLGPIGSNGLAAPRDFLYPEAAFEEKTGHFQLFCKFQGRLWQAPIDHSPLDVVGWHGNYAPYKYDLNRFNTMNSVSFDHPDPSIFTVLTSPSEVPGTANLDFVIFPPRWMVAERTFRPPYFHRNVMSEFMGLIHGIYDAKEEGFLPGGSSLHNVMTPHGPEAGVFDKASTAALKPQYQGDTLAFMFESRLAFRVSAAAASSPHLQHNYRDCWKGLKAQFRNA